MKPLQHVAFLFVTVFLGLVPCHAQDTVLFDNAFTVNVDGVTSSSGYIFDDGGPTANYSNNFAGMVIITARLGDTIELTGTYTTERMSDYLYVYNGSGRTGTTLGTYSGSGNLHCISVTSVMTLYFTSNALINRSGFELLYTVHPSACNNFIANFSYTDISASDINLVWLANNANDTFQVSYGTTSTTVVGSSCRISSLSPRTNYTFHLSSLSDTGSTGCLRTLNVQTPCVTAYIHGAHPICREDTILLTADSAGSYLWSTGDTTRSILVTQPGDYSLVVSSSGGCSDTDHVRIPQRTVGIDISIPHSLCPGDSTLVSVGLSAFANIHVNMGQNILSEANRIFLPDGVSCSPYGCSYRSELAFSDFDNNAQITGVNDIRYVMLNLEHTYAGDLYINITCPNGQSADLLRYGGSGHSQCNSSIASSSRGWQNGINANPSTNFGQPNSGESSNACDSTAVGNSPGIGWRYCWSNATDAGYSYASGDGLIYRASNVHSSAFDSSNVLLGTHFYRPDQSLASLIGCPMNGTWYIEVIDGWSGDNGYIFGWTLALNPERLSHNDYVPSVSYADLLGPWVDRHSDTTFSIHAPDSLVADTTVTYTVHIYDSSGCRFDTSFSILFRALSVGDTFAVACDSFLWRGNTYYQSTTDTLASLFSNAAGCDSSLALTLTLLQSTRVQFFDTCTEAMLPRTFHDSVFYTDTADVLFTVPIADGCDSMILYSLHVLRNVYTNVDTSLCADQLPITWHGHLFTDGGSYTATLSCRNGADSIVTYTLHTNPVYTLQVADTICQGSSLLFGGQSLSLPGKYTDSLLTTALCDSVVHLQLALLDTIHIELLHESRCQPPAHLVSCNTSPSWRYQWTADPSDPDLLPQQRADHITVSPVTPTTYYLVVSHSNTDFCSATDSIFLSPITPIHVDWDININGQQLEIINTSTGYTSQSWYVNGQLSDNHSSRFLYSGGDETDSIRVTLVLSNDFCSDSISKTIVLVHSAIYFPNVFTPGAMDNNRFAAIGSGILEYEIWIFDRRGVKVYHGTDINNGWDGTCNGRPCQQAAYTYFCRYRDHNSAQGYQTAKGTILLLR
ncbi:MAG: gliding motility-associated C-terminal domain-containing protein [Bacteroidales bacterium]|nr:gliding motility-associated C-terminal domain-containing protein [Bacteroidales bacterium]